MFLLSLSKEKIESHFLYVLLFSQKNFAKAKQNIQLSLFLLKIYLSLSHISHLQLPFLFDRKEGKNHK